ncbi:hypothetical protein [Neptuniibacter sp. QD37_11]|uniref:hypothetical protein n=1 Tax=Neptuniibacter sp. QD37_11 TaxID=3398209 RepID=UPI0039F50378
MDLKRKLWINFLINQALREAADVGGLPKRDSETGGDEPETFAHLVLQYDAQHDVTLDEVNEVLALPMGAIVEEVLSSER